MFQIVLAIHAVLCFILVALVLLQEGKDIGAAFGAGGSNTLFGASGIDKPIVRATTFVAILFMITSIILVNLYTHAGESAAAKPSALPEELKRLNQAVQVEEKAAEKGAEKAAQQPQPQPAPEAQSAPAPAAQSAPAPVAPAAEQKAVEQPAAKAPADAKNAGGKASAPASGGKKKK